MRNLLNIEKSVFRHGEYVGYIGGSIYHISKCNHVSGNWRATLYLGPAIPKLRPTTIYSRTLDEMSEKLASLPESV